MKSVDLYNVVNFVAQYIHLRCSLIHPATLASSDLLPPQMQSLVFTLEVNHCVSWIGTNCSLCAFLGDLTNNLLYRSYFKLIILMQ